jgi:hypothetical protein
VNPVRIELTTFRLELHKFIGFSCLFQGVVANYVDEAFADVGCYLGSNGKPS